MSDGNQPRMRIRIARGSKEALEQLRGSLESGELFWQKQDLQNDEMETNVGTTESEKETVAQ